MPKEVRDFYTYKENLIDSVFKLYNNNSSIKSQLQRSDLRLQIAQNLTKIKESLKSSMKNTPTSSFLFNNDQELFNMQTSLIELADHLLTYLDEFDDTLQKATHECLKLIMNRGELDLGCMGFPTKYIKCLNF